MTEFSAATQAFLNAWAATKSSPPPPLPFSPARWPYTYAYDYVRTHVATPLSRGEVGGMLKVYARQKGADLNSMVLELAAAYCEEHRIAVPEDVLIK